MQHLLTVELHIRMQSRVEYVSHINYYINENTTSRSVTTAVYQVLIMIFKNLFMKPQL